jgi:hypothetical protein
MYRITAFHSEQSNHVRLNLQKKPFAEVAGVWSRGLRALSSTMGIGRDDFQNLAASLNPDVKTLKSAHLSASSTFSCQLIAFHPNPILENCYPLKPLKKEFTSGFTILFLRKLTAPDQPTSSPILELIMNSNP